MAARALGTDGVEAYQAGDYARATKQLESAYAVLRVPSLGLWSARALVKVGKLVEAADRYLEASQLPIDGGGAEQVQQAAVRDAQHEREDLIARIPTLTIRIEGVPPDAATCTLDGLELAPETLGEPTSVNPGTRRAACTHGGKQQKKVVTVAEGAQATIVLTFEPAAPAWTEQSSTATSPDDHGTTPGRPQRILGWTAIGVGTAGLAIGAVLAVVATDKMNGLECTGTVCDEPQSELDAYNSLRVPSTVSLIAGGALAVAGVTLLLTAPKASEAAMEHPSVAAYISGTSVGLRGRF